MRWPAGRASQRADRLVVGVAVVLALVLLVAVTVAATGGGIAGARTVLRAGAGSMLLVDGQPEQPAVVGDTVPDGAALRAGPAGAVLATRDRAVHLAADARVRVVDGGEQQLQTGSLVVDSRRGPGVTVTTEAATVTAPPDGLVRVDAGPMVRVALLAGPAAQVRAIGRRTPTMLPRLYQVQTARGSSVGYASPLMLRSDALERRLAADLVAADAMLTDLASQLSLPGPALSPAPAAAMASPAPVDPSPAASAGPTTSSAAAAALPLGAVVLTALRADAPAVNAPAPGKASGEAALDYLIATARERGGDIAGRVARVDELRDAGGSWAVVAGILGVPVDSVGARLQELLAPTAVARLATGGTDPIDLGKLLASPAAAPSAAPSDTPPSTAPRPGVAPTPSTAPGPIAARSPSPRPAAGSPSPTAGPPTDIVDQVVEAVLGVVRPSPRPSATGSPGNPPPPLPSLPLPFPSLPVGPLLGR